MGVSDSGITHPLQITAALSPTSSLTDLMASSLRFGQCEDDPRFTEVAVRLEVALAAGEKPVAENVAQAMRLRARGLVQRLVAVGAPVESEAVERYLPSACAEITTAVLKVWKAGRKAMLERQLLRAIELGNLIMVREALKEGVAPSGARQSKDDGPVTPLTAAFIPSCTSGCPNAPKIVGLLLEAGADVNEPGFIGMPPLVAAAASSFDASEFISPLLKKGALIDRLDSHGRTPLIAAAFPLRAKVMLILLQAGASAKPKDANGMTAGQLMRSFAGEPTTKEERRERDELKNLLRRAGD